MIRFSTHLIYRSTATVCWDSNMCRDTCTVRHCELTNKNSIRFMNIFCEIPVFDFSILTWAAYNRKVMYIAFTIDTRLCPLLVFVDLFICLVGGRWCFLIRLKELLVKTICESFLSVFFLFDISVTFNHD